MATVGLMVRTPEVVNNASFIVIFPLTFVANTFVPTNNFPGPLKAVANWNPVSSVTQAARELFGNTNPKAPIPDYRAMDPFVFHIAFLADDVAGERKRLLAAGAAHAGEVTTNEAGDVMTFVRDPWGLTVQLMKRAKALL